MIGCYLHRSFCPECEAAERGTPLWVACVKMCWCSLHLVLSCSPAHSPAVNCRPGLQLCLRWWLGSQVLLGISSFGMNAAAWFPKSSCVIKATSPWLLVENFLLKSCTQGVSSLGIHKCIGRIIRHNLETSLIGWLVHSSLEVESEGLIFFYQWKSSDKTPYLLWSTCFSNSFCVLGWKHVCNCLDVSAELLFLQFLC